MLAHAALGHMGKDGRTIVLVHRAELIEQTLDKLRNVGIDDSDLGAFRVKGAFNLEAPVLVCSVQTLLARNARPPASLVILDECHHFVAEEWSNLPAHYANVPRLGFTATPVRGDGAPLGDVFDALVVVATNTELVSAGHLVPCDVYAPERRLKGAEMVDPVEIYREHGAHAPFIVFAKDREHGKELAKQFRVPYIDGETPRRDEILTRFKSGEVRGIVNVFVLTEGFDCPRAAVCILARGAGSPAAYLQMIGRVRRPDKGKIRSSLLDCVGAVHVHGLPDCDRKFSLTGIPIQRVSEAPLMTCPACAAVFERAPLCPRCGYTFATERAEPIYVAEPTAKIDAAANEDVKRQFLRRYFQLAKLKNYKPGWALHNFRSRFGHWPLPQWIQEEQR